MTDAKISTKEILLKLGCDVTVVEGHECIFVPLGEMYGNRDLLHKLGVKVRRCKWRYIKGKDDIKTVEYKGEKLPVKPIAALLREPYPHYDSSTETWHLFDVIDDARITRQAEEILNRLLNDFVKNI